MLLSLILPIYNVEAYLSKCLESCIDQDLPRSDYEIITVIDGSTDNSIDIAKRFQDRYENIKIIIQENGGPSSARNNGLRHAVGKYIWFIDADDYIPKNILKNVVAQLQSYNLDALWIDWRDVNEQGEIIPPFAPHQFKKNTEVMSGLNFMSKVLNNYLYACCFIYNREFLLRHKLFFTEGMYYEDADFSFRCIPLMQRIKFYDSVCYNYLQRKGSTVHNTDMKKIEGMLTNCITTTNALKNCDNTLKRFYKICFTSFYMLLLKEILKSKNKCYAEYLLSKTQTYNFGKVYLFGNIKTKIIGATYNIFGVNFCLNLFSKLL